MVGNDNKEYNGRGRHDIFEGFVVAKELSDDKIATLRASLEGRTVKDLRLFAKTHSVKLTSSSRNE